VASALGGIRDARADIRVERSDGADSCPDAASFVDRVNEGAIEGSVGTRDIKVRFERTVSGYQSWVHTSDGKRRALEDDAATCDGLAEATMLAVKLALDLEPSPADTEPAPPGAAPPPGEVAVPRIEGRSVVPEVSASGVFAFGVGSSFAPGVRAGAALAFGKGAWSLGITGLVLPTQARDIAEGAVGVTVYGGGVEGCGRGTLSGTFGLALCARTEAMALQGSSSGFPRTVTVVRPLLAGTLLGRARAEIAGPVAVFVEAGALFAVVRERFAIDTVGVVYDPPLIAAVTGIGIVVDFQ